MGSGPLLPLTEGLYEQLAAQLVEQALRSADPQQLQTAVEALVPSEAPDIFSKHLRRAATRLLQAVDGADLWPSSSSSATI